MQAIQQSGEWGTDCQIAAAAHLLQVSILCLSRYSALGEYQIQHVSPLLPTVRTATATAFMKLYIYLITLAHITI